MLWEALTHDGYRVEVACDSMSALAYANDFDVVVADLGLGIIEALQARKSLAELVVLATPARIDDALASVRRGAFDFVLRPFYIDDISITVACACARRQQLGFDSVLAHVPRNVDLLR